MIQKGCRRLARRLRIYNGRGRILQMLPMVWCDAGGAELQPTTMEDGSTIRVARADHIGRLVYYFGDFDPRISWVCRQLLRPGDACIDIGANMGVVALQMARCVGPAGRVHAFEPQPDLAARLQADAATNGLSALTIHPVALSDHEGSAGFIVSVTNCGGAGISNEPVRGYRKIEVRLCQSAAAMSALDISLHPDRPLRLLKLDVEGHEDVILSVLRPWLAGYRPQAVLFEAGEARGFWDRPRVTTLLGLQYRMWAIPRCIFRMRLVPLFPGAGLPVGVNDIVALVEGDEGRAVRAALNLGA